MQDLRGATEVRRYALVFCLFFLSVAAYAQSPPPILPAGDAAVAGFSGTVVFGSPPPLEAKRIDNTYIDLDGPALRVMALGRMGGPPQGQFVAAPRPFTVTARQIGQVFSVALDDADPPNIYVAASSAYGLPIVVPDSDGDGLPDRSRRGAPDAAFMPGLFGPVIADGGPGSIWKIDGRHGAVTLFANVVLNGVRNSGPALGGLTFDPGSRQLFVADRDTGMIHRFTLDGVERGIFDHGVQALAAAGLPPVVFDPRKRTDLQNPAFDSTNPATWGYVSIVRRVFGLSVYGSRLYYAVASGLRVWSVGILPDGSLGADARVEVAIPPGPKADAEISTIAFDRDGRMLLAERGPPTGAYDYKILATPAGGRALRFRAKLPGENGTPFYWQADGDYAVGFPPNFTNDNGGLALGYGYDSAGNIDPGRCGATLWTTGEQLRLSPDRSLAERLRAGGPLAVNGLQGNALELVRPQNTPPFNSYFLNYADPAEQPGLMGQIGGIAIWQICPRAAIAPEIFAEMLATADLCPRGYVDIRNQCVPTPCKPDERYRDGKCVHECPPLRRSLRNECCPQGTVWNGRQCVPHTGPDLTINKEIDRCGLTECYYTIVVTNRGPGTYNGELIVGDVATAGQIITTSPDWTCTHANLPSGNDGVACRRPNTNIPPGQSVKLTVEVKVANGTTGGLLNCAIVDPRRDGNTSNNISCKYKPPDQTGNPKLKIVKAAPKSCTFVRDDGQRPIWQCEFAVTVTNEGTAPANNVTVTDVPSNGTIIGVQNDGSWNCTMGSNSVTCWHPGALNPGAPPSPATFTVTVEAAGLYANPAIIRGGGEAVVENCAALGNTVRRGDILNGRVKLASIVDDPAFAFRLAQAQGQNAPSPGTGQAPPSPPGGPVQAPGNNFPGLTVPGGPIEVAPGSNAPGSFVGPASQSCASIRLPKKDPPTTCVPAHVPGCICAGPPIGPERKPACRAGECQTCGGCPTAFAPDGTCPSPPGDNSSCVPTRIPGCKCTGSSTPAGNLCHAGECMTTCPTPSSCQGSDCPQPILPLPLPIPLPPCTGSDCPTPPGTGSQPVCNSPKVLLFGQCVCRSRTAVGDDCHEPTTEKQPACTFPKIAFGGKCVCRGGTVGDDCHVPTKETKPKKCQLGTHLVDGECVRGTPKKCQQGTYLSGGKCVRGLPRQKNKKPKSSDNETLKAGPGLNINRSIGGGKSGGGGGSKGKGG